MADLTRPSRTRLGGGAPNPNGGHGFFPSLSKVRWWSAACNLEADPLPQCTPRGEGATHDQTDEGKVMTLTAVRRLAAMEVGKYQLVAELAQGGMGNVYLAALCGPGGFSKLLALKELKPALAEDATFVTMFLEEARMAARLVHRNIVQTNEVCSEDGHHYMTMEFVDGRSLARIVRRSSSPGTGDVPSTERTAPRPFPVGAQLRILVEALHGLHYAHELRRIDGEPLAIVHRDISPFNLMVTFDGQAKLLDFGIAKAVDSSVETQEGVLKGRIAYMAPEQAVGVKVDRRADIYAIGVMLWEAVAGRRLWAEMSEVEILRRVLGDGPPRLRTVVPDAPEMLDAICARALAKNPASRYATAADLLADIEAHLAQRSDRMTMREIGEFISELFADERQRTNQLIEEALGYVGNGPRSGSSQSPHRRWGSVEPTSGKFQRRRHLRRDGDRGRVILQ